MNADQPTQQPEPPEDPETAAQSEQVREATKLQGQEKILPAPTPDEQRAIAMEWQRPPGQNSG